MHQIINIALFLLLSLNNQFNCGQIDEKEQAVTSNIDTLTSSLNIKKSKQQYSKIINIPVPAGYERVEANDLSFAWYLRNLSLNTDNTVYSYDGSVIMNKEYGYQYAVINMDIGKRDLQQCADAVMRLRGEYLYHQKKYSEIHFNFLSDGKARYYTNYAKGKQTYPEFRKYMDYIFAYANTGSLKKELKKVNDIQNVKIGDVFIQTGKPYGHAVIVVDLAKNKQTGEKIFMVAQSFMPAQSIHILKNGNEDLSPWYSTDFGEALKNAVANGVKILCYSCDVTPDTLSLKDLVDVRLEEQL